MDHQSQHSHVLSIHTHAHHCDRAYAVGARLASVAAGHSTRVSRLTDAEFTTAAPSFEDYLLQDPGKGQHFKGTHECVSWFSRKSGNVITIFRSTTLPKRFLSFSFYHLQRRKKHRMNLHYLKPPACKLSGPFCFPTWCGK